MHNRTSTQYCKGWCELSIERMPIWLLLFLLLLVYSLQISSLTTASVAIIRDDDREHGIGTFIINQALAQSLNHHSYPLIFPNIFPPRHHDSLSKEDVDLILSYVLNDKGKAPMIKKSSSGVFTYHDKNSPW